MNSKCLPLLLVIWIFAVFNITHGQSNWQQMNGTFTAMCTVPNQPNLIFVGDNAGLIRKSTDKGLTWKRSYRAGFPITDIRFVNELLGFAVSSNNGLIFRTTDGGTTWLRKQIVDQEEPNNTMRFGAFKKILPINETTVIFELVDNGSTDGLKEVITTRDGGNSFNIEKSPDNVFHVAGDTLVAFGYDLDMFNARKFKLYKSTDRGISWTKAAASPTGVTTALNIYGVDYAYFFNSRQFYFTVGNKSSDRTLYKSTDGGTTISAANKPSGNTMRVLWLHYKDRQNGMVITDASTSSFQKTADGGVTWTAVPGTNPMLPATYLVGDELIASNTNRCVLSNNYGNTWNLLSDNIYQVANTNVIPSYIYLYLSTVTHNTFYSSTSALSGGVFYGKTLVRTDDEGLSWHNVTDNTNTKYERQSFHFISPDTMLYITPFQTSIYKSTDGGKTSKVTNALNIIFGGSGNAIPTFSFPKGSKTYGVAYAILGNGNFWLTQDGGNTWNKTTATNDNLSVINLQVLAPDAWFMLGSENNKAIVYTSSNQGASWTNITGTINIGTNAETMGGVGVYFVTKTIGYVFGSQGVLFKTTDGGSTWTSIRSTLPTSTQFYNFTSMAFRTEKEGYLSPGLTTKNNITWITGETGQRMDFAADTTLGAIVDVYGNFYKYFPAIPFVNDQVIASKVTSIEDVYVEASQLSVYPNPSENELNITSKAASLDISIIDLLGNVHFRERVFGHSVISVKDLSNGVYFVKTEDGQASQVVKFLKD